MPNPPGEDTPQRRAAEFGPWLVGALAFFSTTSVLMSKDALSSFIVLGGCWGLGAITYHLRDRLRTAVHFFVEYHAYLRELDRVAALAGETEAAKVRDQVDLSNTEQAEFKRLMDNAGLKDWSD